MLDLGSYMSEPRHSTDLYCLAEVEIVVIAPVEVTENKSKSPNATDLKRKLNELEPKEADVKSFALADFPKEETNTHSSDEVENSAPDAKKPRLEEESDGSVLENGHNVQKIDVPIEKNAGDATTNANVKEEKDQDTNPENIEPDTAKITSFVDVDADSVKHVTEETTREVVGKRREKEDSGLLMKSKELHEYRIRCSSVDQCDTDSQEDGSYFLKGDGLKRGLENMDSSNYHMNEITTGEAGA